ncbi:3-phosphoshikimate 1-carboxyvinyltransferase [Limosilactobacillus mucosae]|uniref:3-phosphoshikimate 1-carboxyvinyltransferase n=1 Tax=Limosilactobacillus mucosae TaxID=97478 RepID=UPI00399616C5
MKELATAPHGLHGSLTVPGDKSISHRAVMLGAISKGETVIHHFLDGDDCLSTLKAFNDMGVKSERDGGTVVIHGNGIDALNKPAQPLDMGNSGTTTRLLMGILAGRAFDTQLFGDESLQKRPMKRVSEPLSHLGAQVELTDAETLPATIHGQKLHGTDYQMQVASAQVKSALIFAALQADTPSTIIEKLPTRNHTEIMLRQFGAEIETGADQKTIHVMPQPELTGQTVEVPGDVSSAAFFLTAGAIVPDSKIKLERVNLNPTRTGIIDVLQKMGADLQIETLPTKGEPLGNITIATSQLKPIQIEAEDIPAVIDELPLVALLAACADGTSSIRGAEELRVKETDRIQTVVAELRKLGVQVEELADGMIIEGRNEWAINNDQLDSYGDHRIGMMDAIAALKAPQSLRLAHADAVSVSYPKFFQDLQKLLGGGQA